jgi:DNA-binding NtrC family response regulator
VLQSGDVERVGSSKARHVDVRVLSATNANLQQEVADGRFREDLLFRLNTIEIHLPALRDRREDIAPLAMHFLRRHAARYRKTLTGFDAGAMQMMLAHAWPGNIRELDHAIERAVLLAQGEQLRAIDLGLRATSSAAPRLEDLPLEDVEKMLIQKSLARYEGNVSRAAQALGLSRSALYRRIASYGL